METITQNRPVAFRAIQLAEAIVVAPLMDQFEKFVTKEAENTMPHPANNKGEKVANILLTDRQIRSIAFVLSELGFRTSNGSYFSNPSSNTTTEEG